MKKPKTYTGIITEISCEDPKDQGIRKKIIILKDEGNNEYSIEFKGDYQLAILKNFSVHDTVKIQAYGKVAGYNQYLAGHTIKMNAQLVSQNQL